MGEATSDITMRGLKLARKMHNHAKKKYPFLPLPPIAEELYQEESPRGPAVVAIYDTFLSAQELEEMPIAMLRASQASNIEVVVAHGEDSLLVEKDAVYLRWGVRSRAGHWEVVHYPTPVLVGYIRLSPYDFECELEPDDLRRRGIPGIFNRSFEQATTEKDASLLLFLKARIPVPDSFVFHQRKFNPRTTEEIRTKVSSMVEVLGGLSDTERLERVTARLRELEARAVFRDGVVIKPTNGSLGMDVTIAQQASVEEIAADVMGRVGSILVQRRIVPKPLVLEGVEFDWNYRVLVIRDSSNEPAVADIEIRYGARHGVINAALGAKRMLFEDFTSAMEIDCEAERARIVDLSLRMFRSLDEGPWSRDPQQDCAGLDIIEDELGQPYALEINGSLAMGYLGLDELGPEEPSSASGLVRLMSLRAKVYASTRTHLAQRSQPEPA